MRVSTIGGVAIRPALPTSDVTFEGGGRPVTETVTIDGTILGRLSPKRASSKLSVQLSGTNGMRRADAEALAALAATGEPFTVTLAGYEVSGTFAGCVFEDMPRFPPIPGSHDWVQARFTIYIPQ